MYARILRMKLKPNAAKGFVRVHDDEIIPALKRFTGFSGLLTMVSTDGAEAIGLSMWERKANAESYAKEGSSTVLKALERYVEGTPEVRTYDLTNSTLEVFPVRKAA